MVIEVKKLWEFRNDSWWFMEVQIVDGRMLPFKPPEKADDCTNECKYTNMEYTGYE